MATPTADSYTAASGQTVYAGMIAPVAPDTTAPSWGVATLSGSAITSTSYTLAASAAATDAVGVTGYRYRIGGGAWVTGAGYSFAVTGRTPGSTDACEMQAQDAAGNWSASISCNVTLAASPAPFQVVANAMWTPGSSPGVAVRSGSLYVGWVNDVGTSGISKYDLTTRTSVDTNLSSAAYENNAHNNPTTTFMADGRVLACWCRHNDASGLVYNLSSSAESITTFAAGVRLTDGAAISYNNTWSLSQNGKTFVSYRLNASNPRPSRVRSTLSNDGTSWDAARTWITDPAERPYPKFLSDGVNRVDMVFTKGHPAEVATCNLFHAYMQLDGANVEKFYSTNGTLLGTSGVTPLTATAITASGKQWSYDLATGPDGELWLLFIEFVSTTDHRIKFVKTTGGKSAWGTPVELIGSAGPLYALETYSHGGAVFNATDPTKVCLSTKVGSHFELQEWLTSNSGASWSKVRDITTGSSVDNFGPLSPANHDGRSAYVWCKGTITDWNAGFSAAAMAVVG